ncbi:hypothetical protein GOODEAATRI_007064 [Goodea atripinnis]|uniref:GDT1 family protein n=1 Tax=Goodea atripinnis TaxID=208336 RepID=A0ABV0NSU8_9TELE
MFSCDLILGSSIDFYSKRCNLVVLFVSQKASSPHPVGPIVTEDGSRKGNLGFIHAFVASFSVIIVSELGDKTFFIAAIMAMRYNRLTVLAGAMLALGIMTCLSGTLRSSVGKLQRSKLLNGTADVEAGTGTTLPQPKWHTLISPIFIQAFTLTFLAEWGDRSQLTTIILAAREVCHSAAVGRSLFCFLI